MKKVLSVILAAAMLLMCGAATAGEGDRTLLMMEDDLGYFNSIQTVLATDETVYAFLFGSGQELKAISLKTGETATFDLQEMMDRMSGLTAEGEEPAAPDEDGLRWTESVQAWFEKDGEIYALVNRIGSAGERSRMDGGHVRRLILADGKAELEQEDAFRLDWSGMTETEGSRETSRYISTCAAQGNTLYIGSYDENGNQMLGIFDLAAGGMTERMIPEMNDFMPAQDGRLMVCQYEWGEDPAQVYSFYDPATESLEPLIRIGTGEAGTVGSFAWQAETDTAYFVRNGEVFAAPERDLSRVRAVNECLISGREFARLTADGRLLVWDYSHIYLRNTDPALRSEISLRIRPFEWGSGLDKACNRFQNEQGGISLIREDYGDENTLLQGMMNQDASVDVYLIGRDSGAFSAVLGRGYTADLSGNAKLAETMERVYPAFRESLSPDGRLMAVPLTARGTWIGYNPDVLEKLGLEEKDLPKTWNRFFDFLETLPELLEGKGIRAFSLYTYRDSFQTEILRQILNQYILARGEAALNSEELRGLLDRLQHVNFDRLGILTDEEIEEADQQGRYEEMGGGQESLLTIGTECGLAVWEDSVPLLTALQEGEEPILPVSMSVAFVNPWSAHPQEAMLFLESLMECLDTENAYTLLQDRSEPVRNPGHEQEKRELEKWLNTARKSLENAADEDERISWEKVVGDYEKALEDFDEYSWMISADTIARYQARAKYLRPITWNLFGTLQNGDSGEEFWNMQTGFAQGTVSAGDLLSYLDKKVQMMRLEDL